MNRQIRKVGIFIVLLFVLLLGNLTWVQYINADSLNNNKFNGRLLLKEYQTERGSIVSADGATLAKSIATDDKLKYLRTYPQGALTGQITGYYSFIYGSDYAERAFNRELLGSETPVTYSSILQRLEGELAGNDTTLTIDTRLQKIAADALGERKGAVIALNPKTGAVLASYSYPSFDPSALSSHDAKGIRQSWQELHADPSKPLLARAFRERYPPGSTFKIVTASAALTHNKVKGSYPELTALQLPNTKRPLKNTGSELCGGDLTDSFAHSCNTTFAQMAMDVGGTDMATMAEAFGFNAKVPFDLGAARSIYPNPAEFKRNIPGLAQSGIGQFDVAATPLEMALVGSAVANKGVIMEPHVADTVRDRKGNVVKTFTPKPWKQPITPEIADQIAQLMEAVVDSGTGRNAQIDGIRIAGKTGTSQNQGEDHASFVAFGPIEDPQIVVYVIVENAGFGSREAAPVAKTLMEAALKPNG